MFDKTHGICNSTQTNAVPAHKGGIPFKAARCLPEREQNREEITPTTQLPTTLAEPGDVLANVCQPYPRQILANSTVVVNKTQVPTNSQGVKFSSSF